MQLFHQIFSLSLFLFILRPTFKIKQKHITFLSRKIITIEIIDRDQYQRNETFLLRLAEPVLINDDETERLGTCAHRV